MAQAGTMARLHVVLLAGGGGTRFWPLSRRRWPKQFLPLADGKPLLLATWERVRKLAPAERIWVVTPEALAPAVRKMLPELGRRRLILEPSPRDTAPAIGLACAVIEGRHPEAIVAVFPTDHVVRKTGAFARTVRVAVAAAARGALVCFGIRPDRPATGFGYVKCASVARTGRAVPVERFVEKPDLARARRYLRSGRYLWNGGMFVWEVGRFLEELGRHAPRTLRAVRAAASGKTEHWSHAERNSVDYAVMEKAKGVYVVPLDAGWEDVGSWDAAARLREAAGRAVDRRHILLDSGGSVVFSERPCVALVDLPGVVVVDTADALLVVSRGHAERVRDAVRALEREGREDLL